MRAARAEMELLALTRTINLTYGTAYTFEQIADWLRGDSDYRMDAIYAHLKHLNAERKTD